MDGVGQPVIGKTVEGRPVKLEGNPDHPANIGATDPFIQAALLELYDPARSAAPLHCGQPATWAQAESMIAKLRTSLDENGGAGFRLLTGPVGSPTLLRLPSVRKMKNAGDGRWKSWLRAWGLKRPRHPGCQWMSGLLA